MNCNLTNDDRYQGKFCRSLKCSNCINYKDKMINERQIKDKITKDEIDNLNKLLRELSLSTGKVLGLLSRNEIQDHLNQTGFSNESQERLSKHLWELSRFFYLRIS